MIRKIQVISVTNTVLAAFQTGVNTVLNGIPGENVISIQFTTSGTAGAPRYSALITFYQYQ